LAELGRIQQNRGSYGEERGGENSPYV